jgi:hypothetical protein
MARAGTAALGTTLFLVMLLAAICRDHAASPRLHAAAARSRTLSASINATFPAAAAIGEPSSSPRLSDFTIGRMTITAAAVCWPHTGGAGFVNAVRNPRRRGTIPEIGSRLFTPESQQAYSGIETTIPTPTGHKNDPQIGRALPRRRLGVGPHMHS